MEASEDFLLNERGREGERGELEERGRERKEKEGQMADGGERE